jgi:hypothetical protein
MRVLNNKRAIVAVFLVSMVALQKISAQVQSATIKASFTKASLPATPIKMQDLISGQYKDLNPYTKLMMMSNVPGSLPMAASSAKTATVNGVTYTLQKVPFSSPDATQNVGSAVSQSSPDGLKSCTIQKAKADYAFQVLNQFATTAQVNVGAIFSDQSVVNSTYSRLNLSRKSIQITTDLVDFTQHSSLSNLETINDPDNTGQINQAIANLERKNKNAKIPAYIVSDVFQVHSAGQLSVALSSNASANLEALIGVPVSVGQNESVTADSRFDVNQVAAVVVQPFFNISVATPPSEILNGTVPANAVMVNNVVYGRIAIITAVSTMASADLQAALKESIDVTDAASVSESISAKAKALFDASAIKLYIFGGDATLANGVVVGSLEQFKSYITGMKPTVSSASGVPIAYQLRYIQDDAPVFLKAVTDFSAVECKRASQIRMSMSKILVTKVVDFGGDEELFGDIKATFNNKTQTLWSVSSANSIKKGENQFIGSTGDEKFINVFADEINNNSTINLQLNIKDKIESGLEALGASDQAKRDGFVSYSPSSVSVQLMDILNANGGVFTKTYTLNEGSAEVKVTLTFKLQ